MNFPEKKSERVILRIQPTLKAQLKKLATKRGVTLSTYALALIKEGVVNKLTGLVLLMFLAGCGNSIEPQITVPTPSPTPGTETRSQATATPTPTPIATPTATPTPETVIVTIIYDSLQPTPGQRFDDPLTARTRCFATKTISKDVGLAFVESQLGACPLSLQGGIYRYDCITALDFRADWLAAQYSFISRTTCNWTVPL